MIRHRLLANCALGLCAIGIGMAGYAMAAPAGAIAWTKVADIDCVTEAPASAVGESKVVQSEIGVYREAGDRSGDRFVYSFKLSAPNRLVRATVLYPDDKMRTAGVSAWGPPQEALGSGFMCGEDVPLSKKMLRREFLYFSLSQDAALVFSTEAANQPAAVQRIVIEDALPDSMPASRAKLAATSHRTMGFAWEDPILARCFGEPDSVDGASFDRAIQRCVRYAEWAGLDEVCYPAYWFNSPMYDSAVTRNYPMATRLHPKDSIVRLAKGLADHDMRYTPVLNIYKPRGLKEQVLPERDVIAGKPSVNAVSQDGRITNWDNYAFDKDAVAVALHPEVQDECRALVKEVAENCAPYSSFKGVDLAMWPGSVVKLGSSAPGDAPMSFDDFSVNGFCAAYSLQPPGEVGDSGRFKARAEWLHQDDARWKSWIRWRADQMTKFYLALADELTAVSPSAKLGICIYMAHGRPENEGADINEQILASGIDIDALTRSPKISVKRYGHQMLPRWRLRNNMPRPKNLNLENSAEFQAPFAKKPNLGFIIHQQYFESRVEEKTGLLSLPSPFPSELVALKPNAGLRVIEPLPSGRDYLRFFAHAIRNYDPMSMSVGGYVLGTQGAEPEIREMAMAFAALPAVNFQDVVNSDQSVVRYATVEGKAWIYALNLSAVPLTVSLSLSEGEVRDAVTGEPPTANSLDALQLKPYELRVFRGAEPVKVMSATVEQTKAR